MIYLDNSKALLFDSRQKSNQAIQEIDSVAAQILLRCDGTKSILDIAKEFKLSLNTVERIIKSWGLLPVNKSTAILKKAKQAFFMLNRKARVISSANNHINSQNIDHYHRNSIGDAFVQFEQHETTLSHFYRFKHPTLDNLNYGQAFCKLLVEQQKIDKGFKIIEIGCGTGIFAFNLLHYLKNNHTDLFESITYCLFDLSPALQCAQKNRLKEFKNTKYLLGNIEDYDFKDKRFDLVICNEVIADLSTQVANKENLINSNPTNQAEKFISNYSLRYDQAPNKFVVNNGAMALIEKLQQFTNDNATIYLSEYGRINQHPIAVDLDGHTEHGIHFGHLYNVASQLKLKPTLMTISKLLNFNESIEVMDKESQILLTNVAQKKLNVTPPRCAIDHHLYEKLYGDLATKLFNVNFSAISESRALLNPALFYCLILST